VRDDGWFVVYDLPEIEENSWANSLFAPPTLKHEYPGSLRAARIRGD